MRPELLVNVAELLRQPGLQRHTEACIPLAELDAADPHLSGDVAVDVTLTSTLDDIVVVGRLTVAWSDECRRCLRPLADMLLVDVEERYAEPDPTGRRVVDPGAFPIEHGQVDLAPMVREGVLLAVPDAPLCRPDCPGLCPTCGADLSLGPCGCPTEVRDERWAALNQLKLDEP
jgi:DUF177 domain-containing protein